MSWRNWLPFLLLPLLASLWLPARADEGDDPDPDEIPQVGRPADLPFSEASGTFRVELDTDLTTVQVEDPLVLTIRVTATGPVRKPPRRLPLREFPAYRDAFHIEDLPDSEYEAVHAANVAALLAAPGPERLAVLGPLLPRTVWDFRYQLRPKNTRVAEIPSLPFAFYNPVIPSPERRFQVMQADSVPVEVRAREAVQVRVQGPARAFELEHGSGLLARQSAWGPPGVVDSIVLFLLPPMLCLGWYLVWRRLYPDAARLARVRRSQAAALALEALGRRPRAPGQRAVVALGAVTRYLRQRLDLPGAEPTPQETAGHLQRLGCSDMVAGETLRFYQACDAARFLPAPPTEAAELPEWAVRLILALEAETWNPTPI